MYFVPSLMCFLLHKFNLVPKNMILIKYDRFYLQIVIVKLIILIEADGRSKEEGMIYILMGTDIKAPFMWIGLRQTSFTERNCSHINCYITDDPFYLNNITDYDVLLYNAVGTRGDSFFMPEKRYPRQIYVFSSLESSSNYPLENPYFNGFFNMTWTYKLNSDLVCPYFVVRNRKGEIIGPQIDMHWMNENEMKPVSHYIKYKLRNKKIAAAWFVSHCNAPSERLTYIYRLNDSLAKLGHRIDMFGECGNMKCPKGWMEECFALLETDYYFYLSFENSFSIDYVTEKVMTAVEHYAVPIVYGTANYNRFMPPGMYINAYTLKPEALALEMYDIITNKKRYYEFFKWHRYYSFHDASESPDSDQLCSFCKFLNYKVNDSESKVYPDIIRWFNEERDWPKPPEIPKTSTPRPVMELQQFMSDLINYYVSDDR